MECKVPTLTYHMDKNHESWQQKTVLKEWTFETVFLLLFSF